MGSPLTLLTTCPLTVCGAVCAVALPWLMPRLAAVVSTTDESSRMIRLRILMHAQPDTAGAA